MKGKHPEDELGDQQQRKMLSMARGQGKNAQGSNKKKFIRFVGNEKMPNKC
jgi:hypothetical protein